MSSSGAASSGPVAHSLDATGDVLATAS